MKNYSEKFLAAADKHTRRGAFFPEDTASEGLALIEAKHGDLKLYLMVDPNENRIADARYFTYGGKESNAIGETLCSVVQGKTIDEIGFVSGEQIEKMLRDDPDVPSAPHETLKYFDAVPALIKSVEEKYGAAQLAAIAKNNLREKDTSAPPSNTKITENEKQWLILDKEEQIKRIEKVINDEIRPFLNFDGGDLDVLDVEKGTEVIIEYQGACGSCASSSTTTLYSIEEILRSKLFSGIRVIPSNQNMYL